MNLRLGKYELSARRHLDSEGMLPCPTADKEVIDYLNSYYPKHLNEVVAMNTDRKRLEHDNWLNTGDWHISGHQYIVDDDTGKVYVIVAFGNGYIRPLPVTDSP